MQYKKCRKAGVVFLHFCVNGYHGDTSGAMVHNAEVSATPSPVQAHSIPRKKGGCLHRQAQDLERQFRSRRSFQSFRRWCLHRPVPDRTDRW